MWLDVLKEALMEGGGAGAATGAPRRLLAVDLGAADVDGGLDQAQRHTHTMGHLHAWDGNIHVKQCNMTEASMAGIYGVRNTAQYSP